MITWGLEIGDGAGGRGWMVEGAVRTCHTVSAWADATFLRLSTASLIPACHRNCGRCSSPAWASHTSCDWSVSGVDSDACHYRAARSLACEDRFINRRRRRLDAENWAWGIGLHTENRLPGGARSLRSQEATSSSAGMGPLHCSSICSALFSSSPFT